MRLPKVICSSVIRTAYPGDAHGGLYIVDLENSTYNKVIDWNKSEIDWSGRGGERGLRGIAIAGENSIYIAASNEILIYNKNFEQVGIIQNKYLGNIHEMRIYENKLYASSTAYDSILVYDTVENKFTEAYCIRLKSNKKPEQSKIGRTKRRIRNKLKMHKIFDFNISSFSPEDNFGPDKKDTLHINNVFLINNEIYFSGTVLEGLFKIEHNKQKKIISLPYGTHNVTPYLNGYLFNNTYNNPPVISFLEMYGGKPKHITVPSRNKFKISNTNVKKDHAVAGFLRGLCIYRDLIIGGASPANITVYNFNTGKMLKNIQISNNVKNAMHGLEIWPF